MRYESKWGKSTVCALALHAVCFIVLCFWLPSAEPVEEESFLWMELDGDEEAESAESAPPAVVESAVEAGGAAAADVPLETVPTPPQAEGQEPIKPPSPPKPPRRHRDDINAIGHPAVVHAETRWSLKETETDYRGTATFYATVTEEGRVREVKEMRLEPLVEDKESRQALEAKIAALVMFKWRYTPSRTADGVPQEQTKREELTIPMPIEAEEERTEGKK